MASAGFFRTVRITILLMVLFFVGLNTWLSKMRSTDWNNSLWMAVYPINGDNSKATQRYIDALSAERFDSIEQFLSGEARRYGVTISDPLTVQLAAQIHKKPPMPPADGSTLGIMLWSLKLRYWSWVNASFEGPTPDISMFVVYYDPGKIQKLGHSLGLQKGMIGVVNAFAGRNMEERNNVIVAHEFLHTLGASDKYDLATNQPLYPHGYAEPERTPLYPQQQAEIMGGRIPLSDHHAVMPESVWLARIGNRTAEEINWIN